MALDKTKIHIGIVPNAAININDFKSIFNAAKPDESYWFYKTNNLYVKFKPLPDAPNFGYLNLDFSLSKLFNGNNAIPLTNISLLTLETRIKDELKNLVDFDNIREAADINNWSIFLNEIFLDILSPSNILSNINRIIKYTYIPNTKTDTEYESRGTIYKHSGKSKNKASFILKAYDKETEMKEIRHESIHKLKQVEDIYGCLRIELVLRKYNLKKLLNKFISYRNDFLKQPLDDAFIRTNNYPYIFKSKVSQTNCKTSLDHSNTKLYNNPIQTTYKPILEHILKRNELHISKLKYDNLMYNELKKKYTIGDVLNVSFQRYVLLKTLKEDLHLFDKDILILTKKELFKFINKGPLFKTPTQKCNAKKAIRILNGERIKDKLCNKTVKQYRNALLDAGIHYVYVKTPIPKVTKEDLLRAISTTGNLIIQ